jgi:aerobic C4-dicarboxylate transport protein
MKKPRYLTPFALSVCAILLGIALGLAEPALATEMKPLGDAFIRVIKWLVGPIVFFTVAAGFAALGNLRQVGRVGFKAFVYFELLSTLALVAGLAAAHVLQPGMGFQADPAFFLADGQASERALREAARYGDRGLPDTLADAFMKSSILQVLVLAILCGTVLALLGERARGAVMWCERISAWMFRLVNIVLVAAPVAAFGAIAFTVGKFGIASVAPLLTFLAAVYGTSIAFVILALGAVARLSGFRLMSFVRYIKEELALVFATSSSVTAMPSLIEKLERAGCSKAAAAMVVPAGYSFNLNGSNIYLGMAMVFLAQALQVDLGTEHYLTILVVAMITSKGASGVAGSAFLALAATLSAVPAIPVSSLMLIVGIERMLKCRSLTNIIGNGVACLAVCAWDGKLDRTKLRESGLGR